MKLVGVCFFIFYFFRKKAYCSSELWKIWFLSYCLLDCYQAALVWHQQLAFPLRLQFSHCWLQLGGNSEYQGWGLYKESKGLEVKWPTQLILGAMGYASRYSRPLASWCFSLRIQAAFLLIPWESWGKEGTAVECWGAGDGDPANSQLLSARALVARSRNSAVPVPASREAAVRGAIRPRELLQLWAGCSLLIRAEGRSWSMLNSDVDRAFIASPTSLRGNCSNGATVLFSSTLADWQEAASAVPE